MEYSIQPMMNIAYLVQGLGFRVWGLFGVRGLGFGVRGLGFGVWDLGFGIWDLEWTVQGFGRSAWCLC